MNPGIIKIGTATRTQSMLRAILPDGRCSDSTPSDGAATRPGDIRRIVSEAFGRTAFPEGTTFERYERTVTVTASEWTRVEDGMKP